MSSYAQTDDSEEASVVAPKRQPISRLAIQRNAAKLSSLPRRREHSDDDDEVDADRPDYSAASLQQLKASTPSTPLHEVSTTPEVDDVSASTQALDLTSKFGSSLSRYSTLSSQGVSAIPSATEIAEKKARRARLAKEHAADEYISLDPDAIDNSADESLDENVERDATGKLVLKAKTDKYGLSESRLVREDEDIMEDFEDFTEDGKVLLGRKAELDAKRKRKVDMAAQIAAAEGEDESVSSGDSDDSEKERNAAYEASQTRHGTYSLNTTTSSDKHEHELPRTPSIMTPLPTVDSALARLKLQVGKMQGERLKRTLEVEALKRQKIQLADEEVAIQRALRETAEKFRALREEKGLATVGPRIEAPPGLQMDAIENDADEAEVNDEDDPVSEENGPGHIGLGFSGASYPADGGGGLGSMARAGLGMSGHDTHEGDDSAAY